MLRKLKLALPAISLVAVVYYADEIALGAPIVVITAWLGGITAFVILLPIYLLFDYALGRLTLRLVVEKDEAKDCGWLMRLMRRWFNTFRGAIPLIEKRLSSRSRLFLRVVGFGWASIYGGAFATAPAMYMLGQRRYLRTLSAVSAALYAVSFVGKYALGTSIVIEVFKYLT